MLVRLKFLVEKPVGQVYGSHLHGLFFGMLPDEVSKKLHAESKKPFSLWLEEIRDKEISLLVGLLQDSLFPALVHGYYFPREVIHLKDSELKPKKPYGLRQLRSQSYEELLQAGPYKKFSLQFLTPCTFNRYGRDYPLPEPQLVFENLLKRWNAFSHIPLPEENIKELLLRYVSLSELEISTQLVEVSKNANLRGFVGRVTFHFHTQEVSELLSPLVGFALYAGVGRKTTMGLGRVVHVRKPRAGQL